MPKNLTRRELMQSMALGGLVMAGTMTPLSSLLADEGTQTKKADAKSPGQGIRRAPARIAGEKVIQPERELSVLRKTGVLVIGGGPAGTAAAVSAKRLGVDVTLVER